jgi:hypothetical protein
VHQIKAVPRREPPHPSTASSAELSGTRQEGAVWLASVRPARPMRTQPAPPGLCRWDHSASSFPRSLVASPGGVPPGARCARLPTPATRRGGHQPSRRRVVRRRPHHHGGEVRGHVYGVLDKYRDSSPRTLAALEPTQQKIGSSQGLRSVALTPTQIAPARRNETATSNESEDCP